LGKPLTNQNSIQEETKSRLKSGNAGYHSVKNLLPSSLLFKKLKIKIHGTIILPVVFNGCETCSLLLRNVSSGCLRRIFGPKSVEVTRDWRKLNNEYYSGDKIEKN